MLLLRGLKMDPLPNKLLWIILLKVVGSTTYSIPTTSKYEDKAVCTCTYIAILIPGKRMLERELHCRDLLHPSLPYHAPFIHHVAVRTPDISSTSVRFFCIDSRASCTTSGYLTLCDCIRAGCRQYKIAEVARPFGRNRLQHLWQSRIRKSRRLSQRSCCSFDAP